MTTPLADQQARDRIAYDLDATLVVEAAAQSLKEMSVDSAAPPAAAIAERAKLAA